MTASFRRIGDTPVAALAVIFAALFACSASIAAESVPPAGQRVFVCAHSFMIYTAKLLPPMAEAAGIAHVNAGQQMIGGSRVIQHWDLPEEKNRAKAALRESKVDVLTLSPNALMPDPGIDHFTKLGLEKNPTLRVLVQASWPTREGTSGKSFTNETRNAATIASLRAQRDAHRSAWLVNLEAQVRTLNTTLVARPFSSCRSATPSSPYANASPRTALPDSPNRPTSLGTTSAIRIRRSPCS